MCVFSHIMIFFFLVYEHIAFPPIFPHTHIYQVSEHKSVGSYTSVSQCFKDFFVPQQEKSSQSRFSKKHKKERKYRNKLLSFIHMEISQQGVEDRTERNLETRMSLMEKTCVEWWTDREGLKKGETQKSCFRKHTSCRKNQRRKKVNIWQWSSSYFSIHLFGPPSSYYWSS